MKDMTIVEVAKLAGVGVSTVSRVLNKRPDVSAETVKKVMAVINEHGYVPNDSARNLKRESAKAIGVVIKGFTNPVFTTMLEITQKEIERNGYALILAPVDPNQDEVTTAISLCKEKKPRGLIFMGGNFRHSRDKLSMLDAPYVMLTMTMHGDADRLSFSSVTVDDYEAGRNVAKLIHRSGHRKVAVMGSSADDISVSKLRVEGFARGWADCGLILPPERVAYSGAFTYKSGYEKTLELLGQLDFTCLFCVADKQAIGAMRAIHTSGYKMPDDISVIGFDGIEEGLYQTPTLTTMRQPFTQMANVSVRILLNHIRSGAAHEHRLFAADFFEGESFAPRPATQSGC